MIGPVGRVEQQLLEQQQSSAIKVLCLGIIVKHLIDGSFFSLLKKHQQLI